MSAAYTSVWWWRSRLGDRKGQRCRVIARGRLNSIVVEFEDGFRVVTSRYAVREPRDAPRDRGTPADVPPAPRDE